MIFTGYEKLPIITLDDELDYVSLNLLVSILCERPAIVIYCEMKGKLYGCISMGDISRTRKANVKEVRINKKYIYVYEQQYMYARKIFQERKEVNWIPVIGSGGRLLGEYKRWDDIISFPYLMSNCPGYYAECNNIQLNYVALVKPSSVFSEKQICMEQFKKFLNQRNVQTDIIAPLEIEDYFEKADAIFFTDREELISIGTLLQDILGKSFNWLNTRTYKDLNIDGDETKITEIETATLEHLYQSGVNILTIQTVKTESNYFKELDKKIEQRFNAIGQPVETKLYECYYNDFFDELFSDEYAYEIMHSEFELDYRHGMGIIKDKKSKYCNAENGERRTVGQPDVFTQCVFFYGPCISNGWLVEDKHTMESFLQKKINDAGYPIKVCNLGYLGTEFGELNGILQTPLREGDIIVIYFNNKCFSNIPNLNLATVLEECDVPAEWIIDDPVHVNHRVYELYANAVYEKLEKCFCKNSADNRNLVSQENEMVKRYIERYFSDYDSSGYEKIGSIVMNCNPFTYGHRYLIEEALKKVDFLIIFVVEEDKSIFTFNERYTMVCEGVSDLENIKVVPGGQFIISDTTFPEYFMKELNENTICSAEYDITLFSDWIAPGLNITMRFVGEELNDAVTYQYNEAMKRIFPSKGIQLIEIPRKKQGDDFISARYVRKCLEEYDNDMIDVLIPVSTKKIIYKRTE